MSVNNEIPAPSVLYTGGKTSREEIFRLKSHLSVTIVLQFSTAFRNMFDLQVVIINSRNTARKSGQIFWMICPLIYGNLLWFRSHVQYRKNESGGKRSNRPRPLWIKFRNTNMIFLRKSIRRVVWYFVQTLLRKAYFVVTWFISSWPVSAPLAAVSANSEIPPPSVSCTVGKTGLGENFQIYWEVIHLQQ